MNKSIYYIIFIIIFFILLYSLIVYTNNYNIKHNEFMTDSSSKQKFLMGFVQAPNDSIIDFNIFSNDVPQDDLYLPSVHGSTFVNDVMANNSNNYNNNTLIVIHNKNYNLFRVGQYASSGVISMIKTGNPQELINQLLLQQNNYINYYIGTPNQKDYTIYATREYPLMSFIKIIKPSNINSGSDWFIGLDSYDITNIKLVKDIPIFAYDAGLPPIPFNKFNVSNSLITKSTVREPYERSVTRPIMHINTNQSTPDIPYYLSNSPPDEPVELLEVMSILN